MFHVLYRKNKRDLFYRLNNTSNLTIKQLILKKFNQKYLYIIYISSKTSRHSTKTPNGAVLFR